MPYICVTHTHTHPRYCSRSILATVECVWCGKFSQVCAEERKGRQHWGVKSESPVYCVGLQPWSYDLWRECLKIWADLDVPEGGWSESWCEGGQVTYFKNLAVCLGQGLWWQQHHWWFVFDIAMETGDLSSSAPSLVALRPLSLVPLFHRMSNQYD